MCVHYIKPIRAKIIVVPLLARTALKKGREKLGTRGYIWDSLARILGAWVHVYIHARLLRRWAPKLKKGLSSYGEDERMRERELMYGGNLSKKRWRKINSREREITGGRERETRVERRVIYRYRAPPRSYIPYYFVLPPFRSWDMFTERTSAVAYLCVPARAFSLSLYIPPYTYLYI